MTDQSNNSASSHALVAFAFVEEAYAQTGDIISGLLPLFAPLLVAQTGRQFDPNRFAQDVCDRYGIPMSPLVAVGLIERLADANLLYLEDKNSHVYRVSKIASPTKSGVDDKSIAATIATYTIP